MLSIVFFRFLSRLSPRAIAWAAFVALGLLAFAAPGGAEETGTRLDPSLLDEVRSLALSKTVAPGAPRIELQIGQLDPRLHLAACQRIEPYVPAGMRLWGKSRIGLRCAQGPTPWNVYLPVTVKVWGHALTVPAGGVAGSTLSNADLVDAEVDLAEELSPVVVDARLAVGRVLAQAMRPGQTLRESHLKSRQWFAAGDMVKVTATGEGFSLESEAQALNNGVEGQPARVRTESGRILTGVPTGERHVEVTL